MTSSRILAALLALSLAPAVLLAQTPAETTRIPIAPLLAKYSAPSVQAVILDPNRILLSINNKCPKPRYHGCDMSYLMLDRSGKLLASLPTDGFITPLPDGHLLLREGEGVLTVLDKNLSVVAKAQCDKPCREYPASLHLPPSAPVADNYCYFPEQCAKVAKRGPLFAKAVTVGARYVAPVAPDELWYMDKKSRVFYLKSDGIPKLIQGSKSSMFATDNCSFDLYTIGKPRILASCPEIIPIGSDDGIGLWTDTVVYDVLSHSIVTRKTGDYFLSLDGETLGHIDHNKFIELEPLP